MSKEDSTYLDEYRELQEAIAIINKYSSPEEPLQGYSAILKRFKETIRQIGLLFFHKLISKKPKAPPSKERELAKAIETIKNHYHIIERLKKGTKEEKKLAKQAIESIHSYNKHIESTTPSPRWSNKITKFLAIHALKAPQSAPPKKLQLPFTATTRLKSKRKTVDKLQQAFSKVACSLDLSPVASNISKQEIDLFRMKAITLLKDHKLKVRRETVQKAPIIILSEDPDKGIVSLFQSITPFPGETIELKGKFRRNPENADRPIPMSDSFHLSTSSTQTGFPHPSQYHGWALSVHLIPVCPHRLDLMTRFSKLQEERNEIANTLLPMGSRNKHGKELLNSKKEAFEAGKQELLSLHRELSETLVKRSLCENCPLEAITNYFDLLTTLPYAYDYLSKTYSIINERFITTPYDSLHKARLQSPEKFQNRDHTKAFLMEVIRDQKEKLSKDYEQSTTEFEKFTLDFVQLMGKAFIHGTVPIILQELSENLNFAPPLLDEFSRRLQHSAYKQLVVFLKELREDPQDTEQMQRYLRDLLLEDIAHFKGETIEEEENISHILNELEEYYNQRYYSRQ